MSAQLHSAAGQFRWPLADRRWPVSDGGWSVSGQEPRPIFGFFNLLASLASLASFRNIGLPELRSLREPASENRTI